jgi:hypothetical protein
MSAELAKLKDWAEIIERAVTSLGIVAGGAWAAWRWGFPTRFDPRTNAEALDGEVAIEAVALGNGLDVVSVHGLWNNRGDFAVTLVPEHCKVSVFELQDNLSPGPLNINNLIHSQNQFKDGKPRDLESKTQSSFRVHFILPSNKAYLFAWDIKSKEEHSWHKEYIWKSPS